MVFIHINSATQKCKRDIATGPVTCAADEETDGSTILCYRYEINTEVITMSSVPQPDPELSGDITGGKVTCLWQTADEQNYSPGLRGHRSHPYHHWVFSDTICDAEEATFTGKNTTTTEGTLS